MSVHELMTLARKHWKARLPDKYKELQAERILEASLNGAANMAQPEIEHLMKQGYRSTRGAKWRCRSSSRCGRSITRTNRIANWAEALGDKSTKGSKLS
jgi:hypothetical protein